MLQLRQKPKRLFKRCQEAEMRRQRRQRREISGGGRGEGRGRAAVARQGRRFVTKMGVVIYNVKVVTAAVVVVIIVATVVIVAIVVADYVVDIVSRCALKKTEDKRTVERTDSS